QRFVSPQVARLLVSSGGEQLLQSHRREIAIVAARLHGFSGFSESAAPEDVMTLLHEFHAAMGETIDRFQGTFERFTGDGFRVFFNDPVPCTEPATQAVGMVLAMRDWARQLLGSWQQQGHSLAFS